MYLIIYCFNITRLLFRMLLGLKLSELSAEKLLKNIESKLNGQFSVATFKKIIKFQAIQQFIINDSFANLENRYTNKKERENNKLYFVLASLYDDLMDENIVTKEVLNEMFLNPEKAKPKSFSENALINTHLKLLNQVGDKAIYQNVLAKIHEAQMDSAKQLKPEISLEDLFSITERKGGYSLLMCRFYINMPVNKYLDDCWYHLGGMIQMTNDLFDIFKDTNAGIHTFANTQNSFEKIRDDYKAQIDKFKLSVEKLDYTNSKKMAFQIKLSLIPALGYVALENLKRLQGNNTSIDPFNNYARKELIIDMEKVKNIIKLFKYSFQIAKNKPVNL